VEVSVSSRERRSVERYVGDDLGSSRQLLELLDPPSLLGQEGLQLLLGEPGLGGGGAGPLGCLGGAPLAAPLVALGALRALAGVLGLGARALGFVPGPIGVLDRRDQRGVLLLELPVGRDGLRALGVGARGSPRAAGSDRRLFTGSLPLARAEQRIP
jgi:hypothetical protein